MRFAVVLRSPCRIRSENRYFPAALKTDRIPFFSQALHSSRCVPFGRLTRSLPADRRGRPFRLETACGGVRQSASKRSAVLEMDLRPYSRPGWKQRPFLPVRMASFPRMRRISTRCPLAFHGAVLYNTLESRKKTAVSGRPYRKCDQF